MAQHLEDTERDFTAPPFLVYQTDEKQRFKNTEILKNRNRCY
jgi:hypothetical protein